MGLAIKEVKNEQGSITSFAGMEINTRSMVMRLPEKKVQKPKSLLRGAIGQKWATVVELQQITGYLNFVSTVVPQGWTFLRRLYNMQGYFRPGGRYQRRPLSSEEKKAQVSWEELHTRMAKGSIAVQVRQTISDWSDASSTKGLGAFYTSHSPPQPQSQGVFAISISPNLPLRNEHIDT